MQMAVNKLYFPRLYWFSGVSGNRSANPALAFAAALPNVQELTLTFHTAGFTTSAWAERERLRIEPQDFEKSKQLKVLRLSDLIKHYDLNRLFNCRTLADIHLECINSEMVQFYAKSSDPLSPFHDLVHWIQRGFYDTQGREVYVDTRVINPH